MGEGYPVHVRNARPSGRAELSCFQLQNGHRRAKTRRIVCISRTIEPDVKRPPLSELGGTGWNPLGEVAGSEVYVCDFLGIEVDAKGVQSQEGKRSESGGTSNDCPDTNDESCLNK